MGASSHPRLFCLLLLQNWWEAVQAAAPSVSYTALDQYIAGLYWSLSTLTTVGYGDITPLSDIELFVATCIVILGATMFGWIVGTLTSLINEMDHTSKRQSRRMASIRGYLQYDGGGL